MAITDPRNGRHGRVRTLLPAALLAAALALSACQTTKPGESGAGSPSYDAMMRVAETTRAQGDLFGAATMYRRAHAADPKRVEPLVALGHALIEMGDVRQSLDVWRQALAIKPDDADALRGYGRALVTLEQPQEAARQYAAALALDARDRKALNGLGVAKDMAGDHRAAQEQFRAALALAPDDATTRNNMAFSLIMSGDYAEAIALLEPLAARPAASALVRQNLALAYGLAGRETDAARVARLDLGEMDVQRNLAYYRAARTQGAAALGQPALGAAGQGAVAPPAPAPAGAAQSAPAQPAPVPAAPVQTAPAPAAPGQSAAMAAGDASRRVQLGIYPGEAEALAGWERKRAKLPAAFAERTPLVVQDGKRWHLRASLPDRPQAVRFCMTLRAAKLECMVLHGANGER